MELPEWSKYGEKYNFIYFNHEDDDGLISPGLGFFKQGPLRLEFDNKRIKKVESFGNLDGTGAHRELDHVIYFENNMPVCVESNCKPFGIKKGNSSDAERCIVNLYKNFSPFYYDLVETDHGITKRGQFDDDE